MIVLTMQIEGRGEETPFESIVGTLLLQVTLKSSNLNKTLKCTITFVQNEALLNSTFISPAGTISRRQISQVRL